LFVRCHTHNAMDDDDDDFKKKSDTFFSQIDINQKAKPQNKYL